jgi:HPt (histidine-containing phosphotransfer) domain-containing protein
MNVDDLVSLVREEYALGLPDAHEALAHALAGSPGEAGTLLASVEEFIERTLQAVDMVGMAGLAAYLVRLRDGLTQATLRHDARLIQWVGSGLAHTDAYLSSPTNSDVIAGLHDHALQLPLDNTADTAAVAADAEALEAMLLALSQPPALDTTDEDNERNAPVSDEDIVLKRDDVDEGLLAVMLADAPMQLERLHDSLIAVTRGAATAPMLAESQRIAHTFKGSGSIIGLPALAKLAHRLEDLLDWFVAKHQAGDTQSPSAVRDALLTVDMLQQSVAHLNGEDEPPQHIREVLERLGDWTRAIETGIANDLDLEPLAIAGGRYETNVQTAPLPTSDYGDAAKADTPALAAATFATPAPSALPATPADEIYLRVGASHLARIFRRAALMRDLPLPRRVTRCSLRDFVICN